MHQRVESARRRVERRGKKITEFLEKQAYAELDSYEKKPIPDDSALRAIQAWNLLGGLEWDGLLFTAESIGIEDIEVLIYQLSAIRDFQTAQAAQAAQG